MGRFFVILAFLCFSSGALAQAVEVRSGTHPGFTRLIIDLPARMEWQIKKKGRQAIISFTDQQLTFKTDKVFQRIPRDRLAEITAVDGEGKLRLELGCDCDVTTFWHGASLLVLDIKTAKETVTPDTDERPPQNADQNGNKTIPSARKSLAAELATSQLNLDIQTSAQNTEDSAEVLAAAEEDHAHQRAIQQSRDRLIEQLGRAASQGLLSPRSGLSAAKTQAKAEKKPASNLSTNEPSSTSTRKAARSTPNLNLQAQSSIDRDFTNSMTNAANALNGTGCVDVAWVNIGSWGKDAPFAEQIGELRVQLMAEFDKVNEEAALDLVRLYLYFGFGVEAKMTLGLLKKQTPETAILEDLASIVERGHAPIGSTLLTQLTCDSAAALWSVLSHKQLPPNIPLDTDSVLRSFSALPHHLRNHLGPFLTRRLLDSGRKEQADKVVRMLERANETIPPAAKLASAEIDISDGAADQGKQTLREVAEDNSEPSAEALIRLIDTMAATGQKITLEQAQLAGAYAVQNRTTPFHGDLTRVYLIALASSGAFDQAYDELERLSSALSTAQQDDVKSNILHQLVQHADEITFLKNVLAKHQGSLSKLDGRVANAAAERLLAAGFAAQARPFVTTNARGEIGQNRQLLRARIALADGQPHQAEVDLLHMTNNDATLLRAEAHSRVGEHQNASALFASTGQLDRTLDEAWLAADWDRLARSENKVMADIAMLVASDVDTAEPQQDGMPEKTLARDRRLIEESTSARLVIESLLDAKPMPQAP